MKFLFIDFTLPYLAADAIYPVGGWAVQLNAWIKGLRANGHEVGVLTWKGANRFVNKKTEFDLIETYDPAVGIKILKYFYYYLPVLYKKTSQYKPDVIIQACAGLNTGIMAFIANQLRIPFIHRIASDVDADQRYKCNLMRYEQISYNYGLSRTNIVLCQNRYQYENLKVKFPEKELHILPNPFSSAKQKISINHLKNRTYVAWLGVFKKPKNIPLLFEIAQNMPGTKFKIAGMPGKTIDHKTEKALSGLSQLPNVEFVGYLTREQVVTFLSNAVVLLNTSHHEGFSNTYLEAFFTGTPVVAPTQADPDFIIQKNGLGASVKHPSDFPNHIEQVHKNKNRFDEVSKKCREYVQKNHDPQLIAGRLEEIISKFKRI